MSDFQERYAREAAGAQGLAIDEGLRTYMLRVYNYMALGVGLTGLVAFFASQSLQIPKFTMLHQPTDSQPFQSC